MDYDELAKELHKKFGGKISVSLRDDEEITREKLSAYYSPGVGEISRIIAKDPSKLSEYTWTKNLVAVISDGSAVLGLGNIGPKAAMPVMEGKSMLFKHFAGIDSVPIVLDVHTADEIVAAVKAIAPSFGAINLEDIAAPICFEVEERLKAELEIPVFHDDQHGTAVVALAGLINSLKVVGRSAQDCNIVIVGAGAAGVAITKLLLEYGVTNITAFDSKGALSQDRTDLNESKQRLLALTGTKRNVSLTEALRTANVFIGVSQAGVLSPEMVASMQPKPIIFALANPNPEIMPAEALAAGAAVVATGRSDFANQINNAIAFPGIFRGALDSGASQITEQHKIAAAKTIASLVDSPTADMVVPSVFDERLVPAVAAVIS